MPKTTKTHALIPIRCTISEHRAVHRYAKSLSRPGRPVKVGNLLRGICFTTLHARAVYFNALTFDSAEAFDKAVKAEQVWVARTSV